MHIGEIEVLLARHLDSRINLIIPNISYGLGTHEIDLLVVTPAHYAYEIEIKTSISDLKADLKKPHGHRSNKIKLLYFAVPNEIKDKALELIPERAGLYVLEYNKERNYTFVHIIKAPIVNKLARKLTDKELIKIGSLACMRIWNLKEIIYKLQKDTNGRLNNR